MGYGQGTVFGTNAWGFLVNIQGGEHISQDKKIEWGEGETPQFD